MTAEEFKQRSFKHSMEYEFTCPRTGYTIKCLVVAINFDGGTIRLWQIPSNENIYNEGEEFWASYEYCHLPKRKLKVLSS